jgi:hypothetical protein
MVRGRGSTAKLRRYGDRGRRFKGVERRGCAQDEALMHAKRGVAVLLRALWTFAEPESCAFALLACRRRRSAFRDPR